MKCIIIMSLVTSLWIQVVIGFNASLPQALFFNPFAMKDPNVIWVVQLGAGYNNCNVMVSTPRLDSLCMLKSVNTIANCSSFNYLSLYNHGTHLTFYYKERSTKRLDSIPHLKMQMDSILLRFHFNKQIFYLEEDLDIEKGKHFFISYYGVSGLSDKGILGFHRSTRWIGCE